jgi:hypothetical protein
MQFNTVDSAGNNDMECPALAPVLKRNPAQQVPNMYPGVQAMLGFKVVEFTLQVTEPYLRDRTTGKKIVYVDTNSTALVQAFAQVAGMHALDAKQAKNYYDAARRVPYLKETRPSFLAKHGATAGIVRFTIKGFTRNDFNDIDVEDVVVKTLRPAIHITDARGTTYASTCPEKLEKAWNAAGLTPKINSAGLRDGVGRAVYKKMSLELKTYCSTSGAKWIGGVAVE